MSRRSHLKFSLLALLCHLSLGMSFLSQQVLSSESSEEFKEGALHSSPPLLAAAMGPALPDPILQKAQKIDEEARAMFKLPGQEEMAIHVYEVGFYSPDIKKHELAFNLLKASCADIVKQRSMHWFQKRKITLAFFNGLKAAQLWKEGESPLGDYTCALIEGRGVKKDIPEAVS